MDKTQKQLQKLIEDIKTKQFRDGEAKGLTQTIGDEINKQLKPSFDGMAKELNSNVKTAISSISKSIEKMQVNVPQIDAPSVNVNVPDVIVPEIKVPKPEVTVNVPPFPKIPSFPKIEMPETMKIFGAVEIANNDYKNPLMVQLIDLKNRPYESVGGGGGFGGGVKVLNTSSEPIPVSGTFSVSGTSTTASVPTNRDGIIYNSDNPMPVTITSGSSATSASNIVDSSGVAYSGSNPVPVVFGASATQGVNMVDSSGIGYSGSNPVPVNIISGAGSTSVTILNGDGTYRDTFPISGTITGITNTVGFYNLDSAGNYKDTYPVSGSVAVSGLTGSIGATILNGEGLARDSWLVSAITASVAVMQYDSGGIAYSGSNPVPTTINALESKGLDVMSTRQVSGASDSINVLSMPAVTGSVAVTGITGSISAMILNGDGTYRDSFPVTGTLTGITNTIAVLNIDSGGIGYSGSNPLPITMVSSSVATTAGTILNGDGTYRDSFPVTGTLTGITNSTSATLLNGDGTTRDSWSVNISGATGSLASALIDSSGIQYSGTNPFPVVITSGSSATSASNIVDSSGIAYTGSNPVPVALISGSLTSTGAYLLNGDGTYRDSMPVTGTITGITNSVGVTLLNGEGVERDTWGITGTITGITNTIAVLNIDSGGIGYSGSNPLPITMVSSSVATTAGTILNGDGTYRDTFPISGTVTGITNTIAVLNIDSGGIGYSGSNPMPMTWVSGAGSGATQVTNIVDSGGVVYSGSNPLPVSVVSGANDSIASMPFEVMTTNRTAKADGADVRPKADKQGRQLMRLVTARDLITTAYASVSTGTETTLFAGITSTYNDLIYVLAANNSTVSTGIDLRASVAGNILMHLEVPPNSTTGLSLPVPLPAADSGATWTVDLPDITGTTVYVSALFSKEV